MLRSLVGSEMCIRDSEYAVQTGRSRIVSFDWLVPLTGFGVAEYGIDYRVVGIVAIVLMLMSIAPWHAISIAAVRSAGMWRGAAASQPAVLTRAKAGH